MVDPSDYMALIDRFPKETDTPDMIDLAWWSNEEILNLALDYDRVMKLDEQTNYDLLWQVAKRYEQLLAEDERA